MITIAFPATARADSNPGNTLTEESTAGRRRSKNLIDCIEIGAMNRQSLDKNKEG
jgi:hypothetical protein